MKRTFVIAGLVAAAGAAGPGGRGRRVKLADKASVGGKELVLNGAGIRTKVVFKVYVAGLYLPAKAGDLAGVLAANPRRVQLNLLRDLSADDLAEALADGIKETSSFEQVAAVKPQTEQLLSIMKSIGKAKEGDVVTMDFVGSETRIAFNGQSKGSIARRALQCGSDAHLARRQAGAGRPEEGHARRLRPRQFAQRPQRVAGLSGCWAPRLAIHWMTVRSSGNPSTEAISRRRARPTRPLQVPCRADLFGFALTWCRLARALRCCHPIPRQLQCRASVA